MLKKGASIEYVWIKLAAPQQSFSWLTSAFDLHNFSENRIFTDAYDYIMEIELSLAGCPQNLAEIEKCLQKNSPIFKISAS